MANNSTQPQPMQIDTAKAHLGIATMIASKLLPNKKAQGQPTTQTTQAPQTTAQNANPAPQPPTNQQNPTDVNSQITALEGRVMDEISQLKEEIRKVGAPQDQNKEILDLKNQIEAILNES